jgi:glycine amidinotransferase
MPEDHYPFHIDSNLLPLRLPEDGRPGILLNNAERPLHANYKKILEPDRQVVAAPRPAHKESPPMAGSSVWLSMNALMLAPRTIAVEETELPMINYCESLGMRVVRVPYRAAYHCGGGLHCATVDVRRRGEQYDVLPTFTQRIEALRRKRHEAAAKTVRPAA